MNIKEIDKKTMIDVHKVNGMFTVKSKLVLSLKNNTLTYAIVEMPPYEKRYEKDDIDATYISDPDKTIYLAYINETIVGHIILRKNWNNYAYVEDIAVDVQFRQQGIGKALLSHAKKWAEEKELAGVMLETQNNNVAACKFYEKCGFILGGFDKYLYRGLHKNTEEIALYWYYIDGQ
ncbi:MAG: GNAT family N-acetyltransferase [Theionarchaea archaeon]|nr:GNAT family N-acetyltransferase [Theionarchaea archaeon]